jgi:hypothetical protein
MNPAVRTLAAAVAVVAMVFAACSSDTGGTSTSAAGSTPTTTIVATSAASGDFVFGSGTLPDSVPADFPIPNGSTIGSTLVNTATGYTEAALTVPAEVDIVALFFEQNLQARGYEYDAVQADSDTRWSLSFAKDGVAGSIDIAAASAGVSRATLTIPGTG